MAEKTKTRRKVTLESVLATIKEAGELQKEAAKESREGRRELKAYIKGLGEFQEKGWQRLQKSMATTTETVNRVTGAYDNRWGDFMENLVRGDLARLLGDRGAAEGAERAEGPLKNKKAEFDLWAGNGKDVVLAEVKTTMRSENVEEFVEKLGRARAWLPDEIGDRTLYGALAFLRADENVRRRAGNLGLFLVESPGGSGLSRVANEKGFKPKEW